MWNYFIAYLAVGALCFLAVTVYSARKKVSASMSEALIDPLLFMFVLPLWPVFLLNDLFLYIPKQRRERASQLNSTTTEAQITPASNHQDNERFTLVGQTGTAATDLRLVGIVSIGEKDWNAISDSGYISMSTPVEVTDHRGNDLLVRPFHCVNQETEQAV